MFRLQVTLLLILSGFTALRLLLPELILSNEVQNPLTRTQCDEKVCQLPEGLLA